jgi:hypothetical protein
MKAILLANAELGIYADQMATLANDNKAPLEIQYYILRALRNIRAEYLTETSVSKIRTQLQEILLRKLRNKDNSNAVRIWSFDALYTPFIYNPEEPNPVLSDTLEKEFEIIVNEPLNQVGLISIVV